MTRHLALVFAVSGAAVACYQDDTVRPAGAAPIAVLLTDAPFPFDSVGSVNIYISRIEASTTVDTSASDWVVVAAPKRRFDLLTLQQGVTALIGQSDLGAGQYAAIRMTIDVDSSSIRYKDGSEAVVNWPFPGQGELPLYALVEAPLAVSLSGGEIVIDFDVGRSFWYDLFGSHDFVFQSRIRAVNTAATGAIAGTVTRDDGGSVLPVQNANVTVYSTQALSPVVVATGHTDAQGHYKVAFLREGGYLVRFEQPDIPALSPAEVPATVTIGGVTTLSTVLPAAGDGGTYLRITGPDTVGVGGKVVRRAAVGDAGGVPVSNPTIAWVSRDTLIAALLDSSYGDTLQFVSGRGEGAAWIVAQSGALADSLHLVVLAQANLNPVATVEVTPGAMNLAVGDSVSLFAVLRDAGGAELTGREISWSLGDVSGVVSLEVSIGPTAVIQAVRAGSTVLRAVSEGVSGSATITVH